MPNKEPEFQNADKNEKAVATKVRNEERGKVETLKPHKVIIWNDSEHSALFVVEILMKVCGKNEDEAVQITKEIHTQGKGIAFVAHKELAELKRDQIVTFRDDLAIRAGAPNIPLNVTLESE